MNENENEIESVSPFRPNAPLGWCSAGQHRECPTKTSNLVCGCTKCGDEHGADYVTPVREPSRFDAIYEKYRNGGQ